MSMGLKPSGFVGVEKEEVDMFINVINPYRQPEMIPAFLRLAWKKNRGQDPIENEGIYDNIVGKVAKSSFFSVVMSFIWLLCFAYYYEVTIQSKFWVLALLIANILTAMIATFGWSYTIGLHWSSRNKNPRWHYQEFYAAIERLYDLFDIQSSEDIGQMRKEEFRQAVEEILTAKAYEIDSSTGFDGMVGRKKWKEMHKEALIWELCEEGYGKYWPHKADPKPDSKSV